MGKQVTRQEAVEMIDTVLGEWKETDALRGSTERLTLSTARDAQKKANLALEIIRALLTEEK